MGIPVLPIQIRKLNEVFIISKMTVNDFKIQAINALSKITDSPRFEAEQLLMWALKLGRNEVMLKRRDSLPAAKISQLTKALERRLAHEPIQYICGEWDFFGLRMFCGKGCLIPRPETEMLAEYAIKALPRGGHLLDLCTGSGCISVSVLNNRPDVTATAIDISSAALKYAKKNAEYHSISPERLEFVCMDLLDYAPLTIPDIIVSNPPYIKTDDIPGLSPEVQHEPFIALNGGYDGLDFYKIIASKYSRYLKDTSEIVLEVGYDIAKEVAAIFRGKRFYTELLSDPYGIERVCVARTRETN